MPDVSFSVNCGRPYSRGMRRQRGSGAPGETSWERVATWYDGWVGDRGSTYHRELAIPAVLDLLRPQPGESILDLGGGQGVLAPYLVDAGTHVTVTDASAKLIAAAKRRHGRLRGSRFLVADARRLPAMADLEPAAHDAAVALLSIRTWIRWRTLCVASIGRSSQPLAW